MTKLQYYSIQSLKLCVLRPSSLQTPSLSAPYSQLSQPHLHNSSSQILHKRSQPSNEVQETWQSTKSQSLGPVMTQQILKNSSKSPAILSQPMGPPANRPPMQNTTTINAQNIKHASVEAKPEDTGQKNTTSRPTWNASLAFQSQKGQMVNREQQQSELKSTNQPTLSIESLTDQKMLLIDKEKRKNKSQSAMASMQEQPHSKSSHQSNKLNTIIDVNALQSKSAGQIPSNSRSTLQLEGHKSALPTSSSEAHKSVIQNPQPIRVRTMTQDEWDEDLDGPLAKSTVHKQENPVDQNVEGGVADMHTNAIERSPVKSASPLSGPQSGQKRKRKLEESMQASF